jgi:hypothetical protein
MPLLLCENIFPFRFLKFVLILLANKDIINPWSVQLYTFFGNNENAKNLCFIISIYASSLVSISSSPHHICSLQRWIFSFHFSSKTLGKEINKKWWKYGFIIGIRSRDMTERLPQNVIETSYYLWPKYRTLLT